MSRLFIFAAFALTFATSAYARPWARIGTATTGAVDLVDLGSIVEDQGIRRAWTKMRYSNPTAQGDVETIALWAFNCGTRESNLLSVTNHLRNGEARSSSVSHHPDWRPVTPDSIGEADLDFVCSYPIGTDWRQIGGLTVEE